MKMNLLPINISKLKMIWKKKNFFVFNCTEFFSKNTSWQNRKRDWRVTNWNGIQCQGSSNSVRNLLKFLPSVSDRFFTLTVVVTVCTCTCVPLYLCICSVGFASLIYSNPFHSDISYRKNQIMILINRFYQIKCTYDFPFRRVLGI